MKKVILALAILSCFFFPKNTEAQIDSFFTNNVSEYDSAGLFYFYPGKIEPGDLFSTYHYIFFDDSVNNMDTVKIWVDSLLHYTHYKYQQTYKGIKIEGAEFLEHAVGGYTQYAFGKIAMFADEVFSPDSLSDSLAFDSLSKYLNYFANDTPAWADSAWQRDIRVRTGDSSATYYPKGKLLWALDSFNGLDFMIPRSRYRLAWRYEVYYASDGGTGYEFYVDAYTGEVFRTLKLGSYDGPATITYSGSKTIDTNHRGWPYNDNILLADNSGRHIQTKYWSQRGTYSCQNCTPPHYYGEPKTMPWWQTLNITSSNDVWGTSNWRGTDVHWMASEAWDYYNSVHKRPGMDGYGAQIRIYANWWDANSQYSFDNGYNNLWFGAVNGKYEGTLDIVGHEFFHGVVHYTSNLVGVDEPGALGESFGDIMGEMLERWVKGSCDWEHSWELGSAVDISPYFPRRSFSSPKARGAHCSDPATGGNGYPYAGQADTYGRTNWYPHSYTYGITYGDQGGVHYNCGVQNKWFYLLSAGGVDYNDNGYHYYVSALGSDKAMLIAYTNAITLTSTSNYKDSRANSVAVAKAIYSCNCCNEVIQTENAWAAVGVGPPSTCQSTIIYNELAANQPRLFPNPANNSFNIEFYNEKSYNISIFATDGKLVKAYKNMNNNNSNISTEEMAVGFYYINISNDKGNACLKLIKQ